MADTFLIARIIAVPLVKKQRYYRDVKLASGREVKLEHIYPTFLCIEQKTENIELNRYTEKGISVGQTIHSSIDDAKIQAAHEYSGYYSLWSEIPTTRSLESILEHLSIFESFYRVVLKAEAIPPYKGEFVAQSISKGFKARPWNKNVLCFWAPKEEILILRTDHACDSTGLVVGAELCDELSKALNVQYIDESTVFIMSVDQFRLYSNVIAFSKF